MENVGTQIDRHNGAAHTMNLEQAFDRAQEYLSAVRHVVRCVSTAEAEGIAWDVAEGADKYPIIMWGDDEHSVKALDAILEDEFYSNR